MLANQDVTLCARIDYITCPSGQTSVLLGEEMNMHVYFVICIILYI